MVDIGREKGKNTLDLQLPEWRKGKKDFFFSDIESEKGKKVFDNKKLYVEIWYKNADNQLNEEVSVKLHLSKQSDSMVN